MELVCPSCGTRHRTEDYPQAFEINCVCGYAILVPDEQPLKLAADLDDPVGELSGQETVAASSAPADPLEPFVEEASPIKPAEPEAPSRGTLDMTSPDELPAGMVYDPFELPGGQASAAAPERTQSPGQSLADRTPLMQMGQFLGAAYRLRVEELTPEAHQQLGFRCRRLIEQRPWLEAELRERGLPPESFGKDLSWEKIPEILAVEIYLAAFELGGRCHFERQEV